MPESLGRLLVISPRSACIVEDHGGLRVTDCSWRVGSTQPQPPEPVGILRTSFPILRWRIYTSRKSSSLHGNASAVATTLSRLPISNPNTALLLSGASAATLPARGAVIAILGSRVGIRYLALDCACIVRKHSGEHFQELTCLFCLPTPRMRHSGLTGGGAEIPLKILLVA